MATDPWAAGAALPSVQHVLTQAQIDVYAEVSGDHNPIHIDPAYAASTPFGGTIAHGMLVLAFLSEVMTRAFGEAWLSGGRLKVRFRAPARPGDTITAEGEVRRVSERAGGHLVECGLRCRNQRGEDVITGEATVLLPGAPV